VGEIVAIEPIESRYQDVDALGGALANSTADTCGEMGRPSCVVSWLRPLFDGHPFRLVKGKFLLLSAFRTLDGAEQFAELARDRGAEVATIRVVKTGGPYVGLGQEAHLTAYPVRC